MAFTIPTLQLGTVTIVYYYFLFSVIFNNILAAQWPWDVKVKRQNSVVKLNRPEIAAAYVSVSRAVLVSKWPVF